MYAKLQGKSAEVSQKLIGHCVLSLTVSNGGGGKDIKILRFLLVRFTAGEMEEVTEGEQPQQNPCLVFPLNIYICIISLFFVLVYKYWNILFPSFMALNFS